MCGRHFDWYHFRPLRSTLSPRLGVEWKDIIWHWNSAETATDRAQLYIERYWEVVGALSIGRWFETCMINQCNLSFLCTNRQHENLILFKLLTTWYTQSLKWTQTQSVCWFRGPMFHNLWTFLRSEAYTSKPQKQTNTHPNNILKHIC